MQNPGLLRKRRPRTFTKVSGLGLLQNDKISTTPNFVDFVDSETITPQFEYDSNNHEENESKHSWAAQRPYFLTKSRIWRLRIIIYVGRIAFLFPWRWSEHSNEIYIARFPVILENLWALGSLMVCFINIILTYFHGWMAVQQYKNSSTSYRSTFSALQGVAWHSHAVVLSILILCQNRIRVYLNAMFTFNKDLVVEYAVGGREEGPDEREGRLFYNLAYPFLIFELLLSLWRYVTSYDAPVYMTSYLDWWWWEKGQKPGWVLLLCFVQDFMTATHLTIATLIWGWITVSHSVSVNYWMMEAHRNNNTSGTTSDSLRSQEMAMKLYRTVQVLTSHFNQDVGRMSAKLCPGINWSAAIVCGFTFVRSLNSLMIKEFPGSIYCTHLVPLLQLVQLYHSFR